MSEVYQCKYSFMIYYEINKVSIIINIIIIIARLARHEERIIK